MSGQFSDYSVEGKEYPDEIQLALDELSRTIDNAARNEFIPFTVLTNCICL